MPFTFSIVIIAKNESHIIAKTLKALVGLSNDIIVLVNNNTDNTAEIAENAGANVITSNWLGYGETKNFANSKAKNDWILSLDADEIVDEQLYQSLLNLKSPEINTVFSVNRYMIWNNKMLLYGNSIENKIRLFNKNNAKWDNSFVHEKLIFSNSNIQNIVLEGKLLHYSYKNISDAISVNEKYALADANKKKAIGKKYFIWIPKYRGWLEYLRIYYLKNGWKDGAEGKEYAQIKKHYKQLKYQLLQNMYKQERD